MAEISPQKSPRSFIPLKKHYSPLGSSRLRRLLYFLARRSYCLFLQKNYRIQHINADFLRELKAPYVLLANHVSNIDPFIYNILCPYPIAWIIGKSIERDSKVPCLFDILRCISRSKEMSDLDTIRKIRGWIADGEVIGIFPEGQTSFSGVSHPIPEATAKLLRLLKVPVVALRNEGGYFAQPRWSWERRCSKNTQGPGIRIYYELLFDAQQIQSAKPSEINFKLQQALHYNPYRQRERQGAAYSPPLLNLGLRKQNLAESMELVYHSCLACGQIGQMQSRAMELKCRSCGSAWRLSDDSHFLQAPKVFTAKTRQSYNLQEYHEAQLQLLQQRARQGLLDVTQTFALLRAYTAEDETQRLRQGGSIRCLNGSIRFSPNGLEIRDQHQVITHGVPISKVFAAHVFKQNTLEFRVSDTAAQSRLFVLEFPHKTDSAFLLFDSLKALQKANMGQKAIK